MIEQACDDRNINNLLTRVGNIFFTTMSNIQNPKISRSFIIQTPTTYELEVLEVYNNDLLVIPDNNSIRSEIIL